jgi:hypothetical protein
VLLGADAVDDLDGVGEVLGGKVPDPERFDARQKLTTYAWQK